MNRNLRTAALAGVSGVAGSYLAAGYSPAFILAPIDAAVVRTTPGVVVAWIITNIGEEGHLLHIGLSAAIAMALFGVIAGLGQLAADRLDRGLVGPGLAGALSWGVTTILTSQPMFSLGAAVPVALLTLLGSGSRSTTQHDSSRRDALVSIASALGFVAVAGGAGLFRNQTSTTDGDIERPAAVTQRLSQAEEYSLDIASDNLPSLVSEIGQFYNVDIAEFDPEVPDEDWSLSFTGAVGSERTITFEELRERPVEHRYVTLRCVGESINGRKMDTAVWTGTPLKPLLEEVDPEGDCGCAMLHAADDYFVQFPVEALDDAFLAWKMNGRPLPTAHGHPVRVLVPGHWGETNVKWLSEIELLETEMDGYWEQRGWHGTGPVNTVTKLWADTRLEDGRIEVAGHAYAGTRGIERVEVSTDGGDTWTDAELSRRLPGEDVWRQWRHVYQPDGDHEVVVRAVDGEGTLQPQERSDSFPSGATGWVSKDISV
ncbi:molybdopterin-dependent oxidoreductase [Haloplanus sp. C73]|uniref:molybdopterin-dependent oxidoreductase n=1 Tax=Haloplanus sp. C73 TaxID=3421641 RepID=UPI003EBF239B